MPAADPTKTPYLVEQYQQIISSYPFAILREIDEQTMRFQRRVRARCAEQIQDIDPLSVCYNPWQAHTIGDRNVARTDVFPEYDRAILILSSNSADPSVTATTGMAAHLLASWDSQTPANFGGDGHQWWRAYYMTPTIAAYGDLVDFDATGPGQYMNWYSSLDILPTGLGTYGDGVDVAFDQDLFYGGSGVLLNQTTGAVSTVHGDLVQTFSDFGYRTFDDLDLTLYFNQSGDFNRDDHRFNAIPGPLDWHLADDVNDGSSHTVTVGSRIEVFPSALTGSARALATHFAVALHAHCTSEL